MISVDRVVDILSFLWLLPLYLFVGIFNGAIQGVKNGWSETVNNEWAGAQK